MRKITFLFDLVFFVNLKSQFMRLKKKTQKLKYPAEDSSSGTRVILSETLIFSRSCEEAITSRDL